MGDVFDNQLDDHLSEESKECRECGKYCKNDYCSNNCLENSYR